MTSVVASQRIAAQSIGADPGPGFEHYSGLAVASDRLGGVDEDSDVSRWWIVGSTELNQGGRLSPRLVAPGAIRELGKLIGRFGEHLVHQGT